MAEGSIKFILYKGINMIELRLSRFRTLAVPPKPNSKVAHTMPVLPLAKNSLNAAPTWSFGKSSTTFPWVRASAKAANLASPTSRDGIGRLLSRADLEKLRGTKERAMLVQAEKQLHLNHSLLQAQNLDQTTGGQACMARAMIRTIFLLTKKQAKGREKHHYQDLTETATTFAEALVQKPEAVHQLPQSQPSWRTFFV